MFYGHLNGLSLNRHNAVLVETRLALFRLVDFTTRDNSFTNTLDSRKSVFSCFNRYITNQKYHLQTFKSLLVL